MKLKRKHFSTLILIGAAALLTFVTTEQAKAVEYSRSPSHYYQPGYRYYNRRGYDYGYGYGRYPGYFNPWYRSDIFYWNYIPVIVFKIIKKGDF